MFCMLAYDWLVGVHGCVSILFCHIIVVLCFNYSALQLMPLLLLVLLAKKEEKKLKQELRQQHWPLQQ